MTRTVIMPDRSRPSEPAIRVAREFETVDQDTVGDDSVVRSANAEDALDDRVIADLSAMTLVRMADEELVRLIGASALPLVTPAVGARLNLLERATLVRLAFLARRCCRNRIDSLVPRDGGDGA